MIFVVLRRSGVPPSWNAPDAWCVVPNVFLHGSHVPDYPRLVESDANSDDRIAPQCVHEGVPNARREEKRRQAKTRSQSRRLFDTCTRALVHSSVCLFVDWRGRCECDNGSACSQVVPLQQNHEHGNHGHMLREVQTLSSQHLQKPHVSTRRILRFLISEPSTCWSMWPKSRTICFCLDHTVP